MRKILLIFLILVAVILPSCRSVSTTERATISVSLLPQKYFLERIIGDKASIHVLVPKGNNPELYDPSPQDIATLQSSVAYFAVGTLPFEKQWMVSLPDSVKVVEISQFVPQDIIFSHDGEHTHAHVYGDPHYWTSLTGGRAMAEAMLSEAIKLFPEEADQFRENYDQELLPVFTEVETLGNNVFKDRPKVAFVIYHPSLSLFADEWGLTQLSIEENGIEPTPRHLVRLIEKAKSMETRAVFVQKEYDTKSCYNVAQQLGIEILQVQPLAEDWAEEMTRLIKAFE